MKKTIRHKIIIGLTLGLLFSLASLGLTLINPGFQKTEFQVFFADATAQILKSILKFLVLATSFRIILSWFIRNKSLRVLIQILIYYACYIGWQFYIAKIVVGDYGPHYIIDWFIPASGIFFIFIDDLRGPITMLSALVLNSLIFYGLAFFGHWPLPSQGNTVILYSACIAIFIKIQQKSKKVVH